MKIIETDFNGNPRPNGRVFDISDAVSWQCEPGPYTYDGGQGREKARLDLTVEMMARLLTVMHDAGVLDDAAVLKVIGSNFQAAT